jgi:uncharacterized phage-associated protein
MSVISDIAAYLCENYPHKSELSKARLTKLVYLADWKAAKRYGKQLTDIKWYFHNFGPYVDDVIDEVTKDRRFEVIDSTNFYGDNKKTIGLSPLSKSKTELSASHTEILDEVIADTRSMYWSDFINHVYSTEPVSNSVRYSNLDLVGAASKYRG